MLGAGEGVSEGAGEGAALVRSDPLSLASLTWGPKEPDPTCFGKTITNRKKFDFTVIHLMQLMLMLFCHKLKKKKLQ